jgi:hypothetical protein
VGRLPNAESHSQVDLVAKERTGRGLLEVRGTRFGRALPCGEVEGRGGVWLGAAARVTVRISIAGT